MTAPPAGISEADWLATPSAVRALILAQQEEIQQLRVQVCAMATELASLRERIGRTSRNSFKPPSSNGPGFKPPERRKGSGRKRGGQPGHPGNGPDGPRVLHHAKGLGPCHSGAALDRSVASETSAGKAGLTPLGGSMDPICGTGMMNESSSLARDRSSPPGPSLPSSSPACGCCWRCRVLRRRVWPRCRRRSTALSSGSQGLVDMTGTLGYYTFLAMQRNMAQVPLPADPP